MWFWWPNHLKISKDARAIFTLLSVHSQCKNLTLFLHWLTRKWVYCHGEQLIWMVHFLVEVWCDVKHRATLSHQSKQFNEDHELTISALCLQVRCPFIHTLWMWLHFLFPMFFAATTCRPGWFIIAGHIRDSQDIDLIVQNSCRFPAPNGHNNEMQRQRLCYVSKINQNFFFDLNGK